MVLLQHGDDQWEKFLHLTFEYSIKMSHSAPSSIIRPDPSAILDMMHDTLVNAEEIRANVSSQLRAVLNRRAQRSSENDFGAPAAAPASGGFGAPAAAPQAGYGTS